MCRTHIKCSININDLRLEHYLKEKKSEYGKFIWQVLKQGSKNWHQLLGTRYKLFWHVPIFLGKGLHLSNEVNVTHPGLKATVVAKPLTC